MDLNYHRLFIALPVDDEKTVQRLKSLSHRLNRFSSVLKVVPPDNYHITLKFFGPVVAGKAGSIMSEFKLLENIPAVSYTTVGLGGFPRIDKPAVLWTGINCDEKPLETVINRVNDLALSFGFPLEKRKFIPHLTVARVKRDKKLPDELSDLIKGEREAIFGTSVFHELVLFESVLKKTGAEYTRIATVKLD